jgi:hypothetical protein
MGLSESFGLEEPWFRRLIKVIDDHPDIFSPANVSDAQFLLGGLGNRQVLALHDWARGAGVTEEKGRSGVGLSAFGRMLLTYDPQLDELGTLWAIHHKLCMRPDDIWFYAYYSNKVRCGVLSRSELKGRLLEARGLSESVVEKKCLSPLLQTMSKTKLGSECGLLIPLDDSTYERRPPDEPRLHLAVLAYMVCDWARVHNRQTASVSELTESGAPGSYLQLELNTLISMLHRIQDRYLKRVLWVSETAGLNSVTFDGRATPDTILKAYYLEKLEDLPPPDALKTALGQGTRSRKGSQ